MRLEVKEAGMMAYSWAVCLPEMLLPLQCRASDKVKGPGGSSIDSDSFQLTFTSLCHRRRQWHPTPVSLPGKSHGWRSLVGYSPWGHKELDTTKQLHSLLPSDVLLTFFTLILTSYEFFWRGVVFTRSKIQKVQMCAVNSHLPPPPAPSLETGLMIFQGQQATAQYCGLRSCPGISSNANSNQTSCVTLWVACFLSLSYLICKTLHVRR